MVDQDQQMHRASLVGLRRPTFGFFLLFLVSMFAGPHAVLAQALDPHQLYEQRCSGCHRPHAGEFVAESLKRLGSKVVGQANGTELRSFLTSGHGKLTPLEIDAMVAHLESIQLIGGLFRRKCLVCHGRAVQLARSRLILRGGKVVGRYTGRDIAEFLENHGRLEEAEIATIVQMLERQLYTNE